MKVQAIIKFNDLKDNVLRQIGDTWEVSTERGKVLIGLKFVKEIKTVSKKAVK